MSFYELQELVQLIFQAASISKSITDVVKPKLNVHVALLKYAF